jgi:hypothetical protein
LTAHFTVTPSPDGSPHVVMDLATLLAAAHDLVALQAVELKSDKSTAVE